MASTDPGTGITALIERFGEVIPGYLYSNQSMRKFTMNDGDDIVAALLFNSIYFGLQLFKGSRHDEEGLTNYIAIRNNCVKHFLCLRDLIVEPEIQQQIVILDHLTKFFGTFDKNKKTTLKLKRFYKFQVQTANQFHDTMKPIKQGTYNEFRQRRRSKATDAFDNLFTSTELSEEKTKYKDTLVNFARLLKTMMNEKEVLFLLLSGTPYGTYGCNQGSPEDFILFTFLIQEERDFILTEFGLTNKTKINDYFKDIKLSTFDKLVPTRLATTPTPGFKDYETGMFLHPLDELKPIFTLNELKSKMSDAVTPIEPDDDEETSEEDSDDEEATSQQNDETMLTVEDPEAENTVKPTYSDEDSTLSEGDETGRHADARREEREIRREHRERERRAKLQIEEKANSKVQDSEATNATTNNLEAKVGFNLLTFEITDDADDYYLDVLKAELTSIYAKDDDMSNTTPRIARHYDWFNATDDTPQTVTSNEVKDSDLVINICESELSIRYLVTMTKDCMQINFNRVEDPHYNRAS